jgi:hypothetical protein
MSLSTRPARRLFVLVRTDRFATHRGATLWGATLLAYACHRNTIPGHPSFELRLGKRLRSVVRPLLLALFCDRLYTFAQFQSSRSRAPHLPSSTAVFTSLTIISLRVLCTGQYTESGIITLHVRARRYPTPLYQSAHSYQPDCECWHHKVNLTEALLGRPISPLLTLAPHLRRITRDPGLLRDIQYGTSSALSAAATALNVPGFCLRSIATLAKKTS